MGLFIVYATGLLIGVALIALSYLLKNLDDKQRYLYTAIVGILTVVGGLMVGGFEGMPISIIGIGILTVSILLFVAGNKPLLKKVILALMVLVPLAAFMYVGIEKWYGNDFIVVAKNDNVDDYLKNYYDELQTNTHIQGFKRFEPNDDEKAIVLSLGEEKKGNNIEVTSIKKQGNRTLINIRTFDNHSTEKNPTIMILLNKIGKNVVVKDTDGTVYKEVQ